MFLGLWKKFKKNSIECTYDNFMHYLKSNNLSNPWEYVADLAVKSGHYYDLSSKYIAQNDRKIIDTYNSNTIKEYTFETSILPVPFEGNIFKAKIIILALNPGFVSEINCELYKLLNPDAQNQVTDYHIKNLRLQGEELLSNEAVKAIADRY